MVGNFQMTEGLKDSLYDSESLVNESTKEAATCLFLHDQNPADIRVQSERLYIFAYGDQRALKFPQNGVYGSKNEYMHFGIRGTDFLAGKKTNCKTGATDKTFT